MFRRHFWMLVLGSAMAVGVLSFAAGRLMASRRPASDANGWLAGAPESIRAAEGRFEENVQELTKTVVSEKGKLALLLAAPASTDAEILGQLDRVLESNAALMTAVGRHVIDLRTGLSPAQRQILMNSCVESLGPRMQQRYRWRGGAGDGTAWQGARRGFGPARGRGGRQYRGGRTSSDEFAGKLQLTAEQVAFANERDPEFSSEAASLKDQVANAYAGFVASIEDLQGGNAEPLNQLDRLIEAHNRLERRVAEHVLAIRSQLTVQQLHRLAGVSRGGYRYRGGRAMSPGRLDYAGILGQSLVSQL